MIKALMQYTILEVEVSGDSIAEFSESLGELQRLVASCDREWNPDRRVWIVKNLEKYKDIPWVQRAVEDRSHQPTLF